MCLEVEIGWHHWCLSNQWLEAFGQIAGHNYPGSHRTLRLNLTHVHIKVKMPHKSLRINQKQADDFHPKPCSISLVGQEPWGVSKRGKCNWVWIRYCLTPSPFGQIVIPLRPAQGPLPPLWCRWQVSLNLIKGPKGLRPLYHFQIFLKVLLI